MSNLETTSQPTRQPAFASSTQWPRELLTPAQARALEFPWEVASSPLIATHDYGLVPTHKANYRNDTGKVIGVVGSGYGLISNDQFIEFAEATGLMANAAGVRGHGSQVWIQLEVDGTFLPGVDPHTKSVWMANAHDGSGSMILRPCFTRLACMNQWTQLRRNHRLGGEVTLRHTANVEDRFAPVRAAIAVAFDQFAAMEEDIKRLITSPARQSRFEAVMTTVVGARPEEPGRKLTNWENRCGEIRGLYNGDTCREIRDTDYGILMAVNEWELHRGKNPDTAGRVIGGLPFTTRTAELLLS